MRIRIEDHHLPGRLPGPHRDVQVGIRVRTDPSDLVWAPRCARLRPPVIEWRVGG